jgi:HD-GYP domain-containing protein (c-di-GMP phosphodiesterase class II)
VLTLDDLATPLSRRPERLHALTAAELAVALSQGLDLAEGKMPGHAQRVCYIALQLAEALELDAPQRAGVFFGALLHDIGVTGASAEMCRVAGVDEEAIFGRLPQRPVQDLRAQLPFADMQAVTESIHRHCTLGSDLVAQLDLPAEAQAAVASHHERWDGGGFPAGTAAEETPVEARVVAAADLAEGIIASQPSSLFARRRFADALHQETDGVDPAVARTLQAIGRRDDFWLGLYADDLPDTLALARSAPETRKSRRRILRFAEVFADISDAKGSHTAGHARRTADGAEKLAVAAGLDEGHVELVRIAALLHDVGLLGVPARVLSKPDILSVTEMQVMRQHPQHSEMILGRLPGFEEIAFWVSRHHERPDGKGYPEMLSGEEIPLEARIIGVADVHAALTARRPHRAAVSPEDAREILLGAAGTQLDAELARLYGALI